jgi:hypothetical protein
VPTDPDEIVLTNPDDGSEAPFGLGSLHSPPDPKDWTVDALFALSGLDMAVAPPASFTSPSPFPPILNQGKTGRCVAFSLSRIKAYQDLRDTGAVDLDEATFFFSIGGTDATGAVPRVGLEKLRMSGYPVVGNAGAASLHRIDSYYAIPVVRVALESAIATFGPIELSVVWPWSWFSPVNGVLPKPGAIAGGHAITAVGYTTVGLLLDNSWGLGFGLSGRVTLPWAYLGQVREAWKAMDHLDPKPAPPKGFRLSIAAYAKVVHYALVGGKLTDQRTYPWGKSPSGAPCGPAAPHPGAVRGSAIVAPVPKVGGGVFAGRWVRIGSGVTIHAV